MPAARRSVMSRRRSPTSPLRKAATAMPTVPITFNPSARAHRRARRSSMTGRDPGVARATARTADSPGPRSHSRIDEGVSIGAARSIHFDSVSDLAARSSCCLAVTSSTTACGAMIRDAPVARRRSRRPALPRKINGEALTISASLIAQFSREILLVDDENVDVPSREFGEKLRAAHARRFRSALH